MNAPAPMRTYTPRRSRRGLIIGLAAAVIVCAVVAAVALLGRRAEPGSASTMGVSSTSVAVPEPSAGDQGENLIRPGSGTASACLGGGDVDISMLLRAQQEADLTPQGAAEFAASFTRWGRWPAPSSEEFDIAESKIWATNPGETVANLRNLYQEYDPELSFELNEYTTDGKYLIDETEGNRIVVSLLYRVIAEPAYPADVRHATTAIVEATPEGWRMVDIGNARHGPDELWEKGTPFDSSGCEA